MAGFVCFYHFMGNDEELNGTNYRVHVFKLYLCYACFG